MALKDRFSFVKDMLNFGWNTAADRPVMQEMTAEGATVVSDAADARGFARTRFIDVVASTLPTIAGSGTIIFPNPVRAITIQSVMVSAGSVPLTAINTVIRYAYGAINDGAAALLLPTAFPGGDPTAEGMQIGSLNLIPVYLPDYNDAGAVDQRICQLVLPPNNKEITLESGVSRFDLAHNITGVTLIFGIAAVEEV